MYTCVPFHLFYTATVNLRSNCSNKLLNIISYPTASLLFSLFFPSGTLFWLSWLFLPGFSAFDFCAAFWGSFPVSFLSLVICCSAVSAGLLFRKSTEISNKHFTSWIYYLLFHYLCLHFLSLLHHLDHNALLQIYGWNDFLTSYGGFTCMKAFIGWHIKVVCKG